MKCKECPICKETIVYQATITACGHKYCLKCLQQWIHQKKVVLRTDPDCTLCRTSFAPEDVEVELLTYKPPKGNHCGMCTGVLFNKKQTKILKKCNHKFCQTCFKEWDKKNKHCYICKLIYRSNGHHTLAAAGLTVALLPVAVIFFPPLIIFPICLTASLAMKARMNESGNVYKKET